MSLHVACLTCHRTFPLEAHPGLVRCAACAQRAIPSLPGRATHVVEFQGAWL